MILISAGDAVTGKLIEQAGFDGIWISGFEACVRLGIKDDGRISRTQMIQILEPITRSISIPIYVDCDTGYGDIPETAREFEVHRAKGICVEDIAPGHKQNSLWGDKLPLEDIEKFSDKIHQAKKHNIQIIARTETLIRGYGFDEAVKRAHAYSKAGADYILIHTRDSSANEAFEIPKRLDLTLCSRLAIVPTMFPNISNSELKRAGYSMIIWANQTERVKIKAVRDALQNLKEIDSMENIHNNLSATLEEMKGLIPE